jgi:hypothetical protein
MQPGPHPPSSNSPVSTSTGPAGPSVAIAYHEVDKALFAEQALAALALLALGFRERLPLGASVGLLVSLFLFPLWVRTVGRYRGAKSYMGVGLAAFLSGTILAKLAAADHVVGRGDKYTSLFLLLELVVGVGVVLWSRTLMSASAVGVIFGSAMLVHGILFPGPLGAKNPLKFALLLPIAIIVFSALNHEKMLGRQLVAALVIDVIAATSDARALFGTALITVMMLAWQMRPRLTKQRGYWMISAAMLAGIGFGVYYLGQTLLIDGYLGSEAQLRSIRQVETSGSLLLGGRPELSATWALIQHFPGGLGPGVVANPGEIEVAKIGMASIHYDPNNGYVDRYMFGGAVELHSTFGDLWAAFGIAGLVFCATIATLIVMNLARLISRQQASAVLLFLSLWAGWNMIFSPLLSASAPLLLVVGLILPLRDEPPEAEPAEARTLAAETPRATPVAKPVSAGRPRRNQRPKAVAKAAYRPRRRGQRRPGLL